MLGDTPGSSDHWPRGPLDVEGEPRGRFRSERAPFRTELGGVPVNALVVGVDEVGRGPLAGPVMAAAVILPPGVEIEGAGDSKTITAIRRIRLAASIRAMALGVGVGAASSREIDQFGIAAATAWAMQRAIEALPIRPLPRLLVDGLPVSRLGIPHEAIVGGDATVHAIGCASIVAKVCRDELMRRLGVRYPAYGWVRNAGYGTAEHRAALAAFGPSPHHRLSFGGVLQAELGVETEAPEG